MFLAAPSNQPETVLNTCSARSTAADHPDAPIYPPHAKATIQCNPIGSTPRNAIGTRTLDPEIVRAYSSAKALGPEHWIVLPAHRQGATRCGKKWGLGSLARN